ncbi:MiaB/RimO family radical SAM methylthiotransferase, partial [bacterium]|nr:MiaB/RimO family radical SAM methylthiotransferase [bacterium]
NVNAYGKDKPEYGSFNDILKKINNLKGIKRIRFMSPHPANFDDKFVDTMASLEHVCRHIHLPLQSGDDTILRRMGRRYTTEDYASIVEKLRQAMPEIAITTDIIVGFPGETNEQFENTMSFVKEMNFDGAFMFAYSEREGTPAVKINPSVPPQERLDRLNKLIEMQNDITFEKHKKLEGTEALVLVETLSKKDGEFVTGKTDKKTVVNFTGDSSLIGKIVKVKLVKAFTWGFMGELISD